MGFCTTISMNSLSGATIISCFLDLILRNVRSLDGSKSLTTLLALSANELIRPAYCTVVVLSKVVLIGMPKKQTRVAISLIYTSIIPSEFTTIVPTTPLWDWIRFIVSSTSFDWKLIFINQIHSYK